MWRNEAGMPRVLIVIVTYAQKAVEKWLENRSSGVTK